MRIQSSATEPTILDALDLALTPRFSRHDPFAPDQGTSFNIVSHSSQIWSSCSSFMRSVWATLPLFPIIGIRKLGTKKGVC